MVLSFANGKPNSIDITFSRLGGLFRKTVTLSGRDLKDTYIPITTDIRAMITCPSVSYKITDDYASENAVTSLEVTEKGMALCTYGRSTFGSATYPTGTNVSMRQYKARV